MAGAASTPMGTSPSLSGVGGSRPSLGSPLSIRAPSASPPTIGDGSLEGRVVILPISGGYALKGLFPEAIAMPKTPPSSGIVDFLSTSYRDLSRDELVNLARLAQAVGDVAWKKIQAEKASAAVSGHDKSDVTLPPNLARLQMTVDEGIAFLSKTRPDFVGGEKSVHRAIAFSCTDDRPPLRLMALKPKARSHDIDYAEMLANEAKIARILHDTKDPRRKYIMSPRMAIVETSFGPVHYTKACRGTLLDFVNSPPNWAREDFLPQLNHYLWNASLGLEYMHENGFVHFDMNLSNLFIDGEDCKVADMSLAGDRFGVLPPTVAYSPSLSSDALKMEDKSGIDIYLLGSDLLQIVRVILPRIPDSPAKTSYAKSLERLAENMTHSDFTKRSNIYEVVGTFEAYTVLLLI